MPQPLLDPWQSFFAEIDAALNQEVTFHCLGGFVAKILYDLPRETSDVDIYFQLPRIKKSTLS